MFRTHTGEDYLVIPFVSPIPISSIDALQQALWLSRWPVTISVLMPFFLLAFNGSRLLLDGNELPIMRQELRASYK